jgi:hypothetical protein
MCAAGHSKLSTTLAAACSADCGTTSVLHIQLLLDEEQMVVDALGEVTTEREEVAMTLCRIFEVKNKAIMLIAHATCKEIDATENPDVIFRANTLATKALDYYMKLVGLPYLYATLHAVVKEIYNYKKPFEVCVHVVRLVRVRILNAPLLLTGRSTSNR